MIDRRKLIVAASAGLSLGAGACNQLHRLGDMGKPELQNAGKPWSYSKTGPQERFEVRAGDHWEGGHSERSEVAIYRFAKFGQDVWQAYSLLIEPQPQSVAPFRIFGQWHAFKDPWDVFLRPPVAQLLDGNSFKILTLSDPALRQVDQQQHTVTRLEIPNFQYNQWHHFVHRIRFDPFGHGLMQVWLNGQAVVDLDNIPIGYHDMVGPYFKYGVYRGAGDAFPMAARWANVEVGNQPLRERIGNPLPV